MSMPHQVESAIDRAGPIAGEKRVLIGMSGGVDSSVAALLLKNQGWKVDGVSLLTSSAIEAGIEDAAAVCRQLDMDWTVLDVRQMFATTIIRSFVEAYLQGLTPNPCVICNPLVKFAALLQEADRRGVPFVATGHYARIVRWPETGRLALARVTEGWRDQTYFLYRLDQQQLARIVFPLDGLIKEQVRQLADQARLVLAGGSEMSAKADSQDVCFVTDGDYARYIQANLPSDLPINVNNPFKPGPIVNRSGQHIGSHRGLIRYTIGQRKGFDVKTTDRLFVVEKRISDNTLVVGSHAEIMRQDIIVNDPVYSGMDKFQDGEVLAARIRSSAHEARCRVYPLPGGQLHVVFDMPVAAPAPGQSCVFYRSGVIMAGGIIASS